MVLRAFAGVVATSPPSTPLGPFQDSAVSWATWVTLMGFAGVLALALFSAGPAARAIGGHAVATTSRRLAGAAVVIGVVSIPAVLTDVAHRASKSGGYDFASAWRSLYDGTNQGRLVGLEITFVITAIVLTAPLLVRRVASGTARRWLLSAGLASSTIALGTTKFPTNVPTRWALTTFETISWMLHLTGGAVWLGGLLGLIVLLAPGGTPTTGRNQFWSIAIRRFSAVAMTSVAAIALSGLFLYWEHVDGPSQLLSTIYGRTLGVKILIFATLLALGAFNQFWLHPRIAALRAAGDSRALHTLLAKRFPLVVGIEALLGASLLFVAPFLHGSARNQAFQADVAKHTTTTGTPLPRIAAKHVATGTWIWGILETVLIATVMLVGYRLSARRAHTHSNVDATPAPVRHSDLIDA
ncbi:MAG: copper resistance domain protein [Ilumatobacteraceae bacterium]|nr:copper resistance domain protein [Ilumatobacteraceae bacterium]